MRFFDLYSSDAWHAAVKAHSKFPEVHMFGDVFVYPLQWYEDQRPRRDRSGRPLSHRLATTHHLTQAAVSAKIGITE